MSADSADRLEGTEWRRVHPLSPLLRMWAVLVGVAAVVIFQQAEQLGRLRDLLADSSLPTALVVLVAVVAVPVVFALGWLVSLPWWHAAGYRVDDEEIAMRRGVVSKQVRTARFDRVQAVDLVEPLAPRLFRLAGVKVETAGGADSAVSVEYLPRKDAEELRTTLLHLVNGTPQDADDHWPLVDGAGDQGTPGGEGGTVIVPPIPIGLSLAAAALSGATVAFLITVVVSLTTPAGLALLVPVAVGVVPWLWGVLNTSWRFTARLSGDVLGVTFGLTERRRQSVPLARIHAVQVSQPLVWRLLGWWKVKVDVAGYGDENSNGGSTTTILPVGDLDQTLRVLELVSPLDAGEIVGLAHPEGIGTETAGDAGTAGDDGVRYYRSPVAARWVSPIDRRRQGVTLVSAKAVVCHRGRVYRAVSVIAPSHIQELSLRRGPVQQMLGLSGVRFDLVPGPVSMAGRDLTEEDAVDLVSRLRQRQLPAPAVVRDPVPTSAPPEG